MSTKLRNILGLAGSVFFVFTSSGLNADFLHNDDVLIDDSLCVGSDCVNPESFGSDTIRLKEVNLRIHFDDTTTDPNFANNDWRIIINDSKNGGSGYFAVEDTTAGRIPFKIEADAPSNALYVESSGDVGFGTSMPARDLHAVSGDTPTLRLEQNGSSGWDAQTWDVGGNENGFFIEDVTNGNTPFFIEEGALDAALTVRSNGNVGIGLDDASAALEINRSSTAGSFKLLTSTNISNQASQIILQRTLGTLSAQEAIENGDQIGLFSFRGHNGNGISTTKAAVSAKATQNWSPGGNGTQVTIATTENNTTVLKNRVIFTHDGKMKINGQNLNVPDYVFEDDYPLLSLDELSAYVNENKHLPGVASASEVKSDGLDVAGSQLSVLEKVEELTLYTLQQHETLKQQQESLNQQREALSELDTLRSENTLLKERMALMESQQVQMRTMMTRLLEDQQAKSILTSTAMN